VKISEKGLKSSKRPQNGARGNGKFGPIKGPKEKRHQLGEKTLKLLDPKE